METRWLYTTSENFPALVEASKETCVIPLGCVEKHGLHLPLGTDIFRAHVLAEMSSKLETFCVFPDFTFGDVPGRYPGVPAGTISLPLSTQMLLMEQLCDQIARNGFKKIVILNCHGGNNIWLNSFMRELENRPHDYVVVVYYSKLNSLKRMGTVLTEQGTGAIPELMPEDEELILKYYHDENFQDGHGTFSETAGILGFAPESVRMDRLGIVSGKSLKVADKFKNAGITIRDSGWPENYPNALVGDDPVGCNARIGKASLRMDAERFAAAVKIIKEDEDLIQWHHKTWETNI